ncbi:hypothetical protein R75483_07838 [Paraburkholderia domus]|nr:hypothetical protein R75483_07838 [Paraburkholderia domus]
MRYQISSRLWNSIVLPTLPRHWLSRGLNSHRVSGPRNGRNV